MSGNLANNNLIVGLNPAIQRVVDVPNLRLNAVNRGADIQIGIGGKGQNVLIASSLMSTKKNSNLLQFVGRDNDGESLLLMLKSYLNEATLSIRTNGNCRTCITLVDKIANQVTEIIEPTLPITQNEVLSMLDTLSEYYNNTKVSGLAIMGSMPPGCPSSLYPDIIKLSCDQGSLVLIDTLVSVFDCIAQCRCELIQCDVMVKINAEELCKLTNQNYVTEPCGEISSQMLVAACVAFRSIIINAETSSVVAEKSESNEEKSEKSNADLRESDIDMVTAGMSTVARPQGKVYLGITDGPHPGHFISVMDGKIYKLTLVLPLSFEIVNPIGAGDAVAAGTIQSWSENLHSPLTRKSVAVVEQKILHPLLSFCYGLSCGTASCKTNTNSHFFDEVARELYDSYAIEELESF